MPEDSPSQPSNDLTNNGQPNLVPPQALSGDQKVIQPTLAPVVVNGQVYEMTTSVSREQIKQLPDQKSSKWRYFFIVLGVLQAIGVVIFFLIMTWAIQQAKTGASGTEFIGIIVFSTLVPAVGLIAFINLTGLPIYLRRHRPHGKGLIFSFLSLAVSIILALYGVYSVYQLRVAAPKEINKLSQQSDQKIQAQQQQFAVSNAKPEITKEEAIQLLKACQLKGFYYTNQTSAKEDGNWAESSSTGVVLTKIDGQPYRISIADRLIPELVPIAREAQKTCGNPQFWHDGTYEQYQNGHWYFNSTVVN